MRSKIARLPAIPQKYRKYDPAQWPGGPGEWVAERESWAVSQPPVLIAGQDSSGRSWSYEATVLGDVCDLMKARREARMLSSATLRDTMDTAPVAEHEPGAGALIS